MTTVSVVVYLSLLGLVLGICCFGGWGFMVLVMVCIILDENEMSSIYY